MSGLLDYITLTRKIDPPLPPSDSNTDRDYLIDLLIDIRVRLVRVETRLVRHMIAHGQDADGNMHD